MKPTVLIYIRPLTRENILKRVVEGGQGKRFSSSVTPCVHGVAKKKESLLAFRKEQGGERLSVSLPRTTNSKERKLFDARTEKHDISEEEGER